tara:strand:- start:204 stop:650 length:447 start_codon:yes stop_codon:yes gene_type:complete
MYIALMGTAAQGSGGVAALAVSLENVGDDFLEFSGIAGEDFPMSSSSGQIDIVATASGGDGNYSYSWTITESGDDSNINTGNVRVTDAGTTNQSQYNDAVVTGFDTGLSSEDPPIEANLFFTCTVTDGTGATASDTSRRVTAVVQVFE